MPYRQKRRYRKRNYTFRVGEVYGIGTPRIGRPIIPPGDPVPPKKRRRRNKKKPYVPYVPVPNKGRRTPKNVPYTKPRIKNPFPTLKNPARGSPLYEAYKNRKRYGNYGPDQAVRNLPFPPVYGGGTGSVMQALLKALSGL